MRKLVFVCLLSTIAACGGDNRSPTAPSTPSTPPVSTTVSLSGTVSSTNGGPIGGASVQIFDGANAGRSTSTNSGGNFRFDGLQRANGNLVATAPGFGEDRKGLFIDGTSTVSFSLPPAPLFTLSGSGNTVFDLPRPIPRLRIQGRWNGQGNSNFIVLINGRLIVNEILRGTITYEGIHLTNGGTVVQIQDSNFISWTFTEVR
jgi:hypothetical protein